MSATMTNGKPRKQLSDQLDRLDEQLAKHDQILDALAEGLNGAVADAAKDGVKEAVQAAVVELLTNIELRAALHRATAPPAATRPSLKDRLRAFARRTAAMVRGTAAAARRGLSIRGTAVKAAALSVGVLTAAWRLRKALSIGLGVGGAAAAVAVLAGPVVATTLSGLAATGAALAVQAAIWVRGTVRRLAAT